MCPGIVQAGRKNDSRISNSLKMHVLFTKYYLTFLNLITYLRSHPYGIKGHNGANSTVRTSSVFYNTGQGGEGTYKKNSSWCANFFKMNFFYGWNVYYRT
jgi:hypothetical protein